MQDLWKFQGQIIGNDWMKNKVTEEKLHKWSQKSHIMFAEIQALPSILLEEHIFCSWLSKWQITQTGT